MKILSASFLFFFLLILMVAPGGPALAQTSVGADPSLGGLYRLSPTSSFSEGCFPPCLCPVRLAEGLLGTFRLTPAEPDPLFQVFNVTEVNWLVPGSAEWVTGSGTYRIGGEFARMHQLQVDLKVGDREVQHFDSGLVQGGAEWPDIVLSIAMNGMICYDIVFNLQAKPVAQTEAARFSLYGSSYEEGCFGPCDCLVAAWPLRGRFGLLRLGETDRGAEYAVLDIDWKIGDPVLSSSIDARPVTGYGLYRTFKTDGTQRMLLDLIENGSGPARFDSGIVPGGASPKRIDIDVAESGFACFDRVYSIHARRRPHASTSLQGMRTEPVRLPPVQSP